MAQLTSLLRPINKPFLQKALIFLFFALILPLFPSQAPEFVTNQTIVNKFWELLHLLFIGIAISYGLFSRRNTEMIPEKDLGSKPNNPNSYVSQILPGLDHKEEEEEEEEAKIQQIWNNQYYVNKPAAIIDKPLLLPVRSLNPQIEESNKEESSTVLPSPIPWRSRSGRVEATDECSVPKIKPLNLLSPPSKRLSPSPSLPLSRENSEKRKASYKESTFLPPAPPPPPPPFLGHAFHPALSDRKTKSTMRSFKDELKDKSMRSKPSPRMSFDSSSSSSPSLVAKSVRTFRLREAQIEPLKKAFVESKDVDIAERASISSDSDEVSDSTDSEREEEEEMEEYSDKETIEKPKLGTVQVQQKKSGKEEEENEVDKKADEFILKFREQIRLQRIESIKRSAGERAVRSRKKLP